MDPKADKAEGSMDELRALLREFDSAVWVTIGSGGELHARPLELEHQVLDDCDLWFVSADDAPRLDEVARERTVSVCCMRGRDHVYLSISASARIDVGADEARRRWRPEWRVWVPDEPAHGAIALVKLTVLEAALWRPE